MKAPDWWQMLMGGGGTVLTGLGLRFTWLKLSSDLRKDQEVRSDKRTLDTANVANQAASNQQKLIERLMDAQEKTEARSQEIRTAHDHALARQDEKIEQLKTQIERLERSGRDFANMMLTKEDQLVAANEEVAKLRLQIQDVQGENRLLRNTLDSSARVKNLPFSTVEQSMAKFNIKTDDDYGAGK